MSRAAILLATYNGEKFIQEQLDSLANQTYQDFTCYIHDDGSTDNTKRICEKFCQRHEENFILLEYPSTGGARNNFFSLMKYAERMSEEYIFFCDQDDFWRPEKLERMISVGNKFADNPNGFLIFSDLKVVDKSLKNKAESFYRLTHVETNKIDYKNILIKGFIPGCAMMISRELLVKANQYVNLENIRMHDWWLVEIAYYTDAAICYIPDAFVYYRQHSDNAIGAQNLSFFDRVKFNVKRIADGELLNAKKQNIHTPRKQANELLRINVRDEQKMDFLRRFCEIEDKNKLQRVVFYIENFKNVYRLWWMLLWV